MRNYEITCLIAPELSEEEAQKFQEKISSLIQSEGGIIIEIKGMIKKIFFFTKKRKEAFTFTLGFQMEPDNLQSLNKKLKDEKQIIRFFTMVKPKFREMARQRRREIKKSVERVTEEKTEPKIKVEIAEIEKKLEEILGQ